MSRFCNMRWDKRYEEYERPAKKTNMENEQTPNIWIDDEDVDVSSDWYDKREWN